MKFIPSQSLQVTNLSTGPNLGAPILYSRRLLPHGLFRTTASSSTRGTRHLSHGQRTRDNPSSSLALWTFVFSKTVKLWGHFFRYPADVVFIPIYVAFGYFHGCIKFWGLLTLNAVSDRVSHCLEVSFTDTALDHLGKQRRCRYRQPRPYDSLASLRLTRSRRPQIGDFRVHRRTTPQARIPTCLRIPQQALPLAPNDPL
jgi:hypothetical protein